MDLSLRTSSIENTGAFRRERLLARTNTPPLSHATILLDLSPKVELHRCRPETQLPRNRARY
jgi:hypothetical protein